MGRSRTISGVVVSKKRLTWGRTIAAIALSLLCARAGWGATINSSWNGATDNWSIGTDWTPNGAPNNGGGNLFNVTIAAGNVTLDVSPTIQALNLTGGTLSGTGQTLTLDGLFTWTAATVGQPGSSQIINATAGMSISGSDYFAGGTINNSGTTTWGGGSGFIYAVGLNAAGQNTVFNNQAGGNFNIQSDNTYYGFGAGSAFADVFNNAGVLTKSVTTGTTVFESAFNNTNLVNVQTGTLALDGGGTESGTFSVSSGATLELEGQPYTFSAGSNVGGAGTINFAASTSTFNSSATYNPTGATTVSGGTVNFNSSGVSITGPLNISLGSANFNTGTTHITPTTVTLSGGTLAGSDTITASGLFTWTGGTIGTIGGTQVVKANGGMSLNGNLVLAGGTLMNGGTATWTGTSFINGTGQNTAGQTTTFTNLAGGNFNIQSDQTYFGNGSTSIFPDQFNNAGTVTKSVTTGTTQFNVKFNNTNAVNVQTGTLFLNGGGTHTGTFAVSSGATLQLAQNNTFQSGSLISGAGLVNITGGTATFNPGSNVTASMLSLAGGTLTGPGVISSNGGFTWSGGTIGAANSTETFQANGGMTINGTMFFAGGTINNGGTSLWTGSGGQVNASGQNSAIGFTTYNNQASANFNIQSDEPYLGNGSTQSFPDMFNNAGTVTKSGTVGPTTFNTEFNNTGTVNIQSGTLALNGGGTDTGSFAISNGAVLQLGQTNLFQTASSITGAGNVTVINGTTTFASGSSISPASVTLSGGSLTGATTINTGTLNWTGGTVGAASSTQNLKANTSMGINGTMAFAGGTITNAGTALWNGSGGQINATGQNISGGNTIFNNQAGATFTVQTDENYIGNGSSTSFPDQFNNAGTFTKNGTVGTTTFNTTFNNSNTVNIQSGTLTLNGGGTDSGNFAISSGAFLQLGQTNTFQSGSSITGAGTANIFNTSTTFNAGSSISVANLSMSGGTLLDPGSIPISSFFTWNAGIIGVAGSSQVFSPAGGMNIISGTLAGGSILNTGTATWTGSGNQIFAVGLNTAGNTTTFTNQAGANFNIQSDEVFNGNGMGFTFPDVFNNSGTLTKSLTIGTTTFSSQFNNTNIVNVQTGTLSLNGGGTETGSFNVSSGAVAQLAFQTFTFPTVATITGSGTFTVASGTTNFNAGANISVANFNLAAGTFNGSGTFTDSGLFTWNGGAIGAAGSTQILNANGGMNINGAMSFVGGTINNSGAATWTGGGGQINAFGQNLAGKVTTFNNQASGTFTIQSDENYLGNGTSAAFPDVFNNAGTLTKSLTIGQTTFNTAFNNSGAVNVQTGTLALNGGGTDSGSFAISGGAILQLAQTSVFSSASSISGAGNLTINGGTSTFATGASINPGSITMNIGTVTGGASINTGAFTWFAGSIGSSGSTETFKATGPTTINGSMSLAGGTFINAGAANWIGGGGQFVATGGNASGKNTTFTNQAGAFFNVQNDENYIANGSAAAFPDVFNNAGTFTKSPTIGTTTMQAEFNNTGTANINSGTLNFTGGVFGNGTTNISPGVSVTSTIFNQGALANNGAMQISSTGVIGKITGAGTLHLTNTSSVQIALGAQNNSQGTLNLDNGSKLDITDNTLAVSDGGNPAAAKTKYGGYIISGYSAGTWAGLGINSSKVASVNTAHANIHLYGIGYADASDPAVANDHFTPGTFVIKPALVGDANLDGIVNFTDFLLLAASFNNSGTSWDQGNFNYDTKTNFTDFLLLSANFNVSTPLDSAQFNAMDQFALSNGYSLSPNPDGIGFIMTAVPEPAALGMLGIMAAVCLVRRRDRCAK